MPPWYLLFESTAESFVYKKCVNDVCCLKMPQWRLLLQNASAIFTYCSWTPCRKAWCWSEVYILLIIAKRVKKKKKKKGGGGGGRKRNAARSMLHVCSYHQSFCRPLTPVSFPVYGQCSRLASACITTVPKFIGLLVTSFNIYSAPHPPPHPLPKCLNDGRSIEGARPECPV